MVIKHLKDTQYYSDLYDRTTVESCLRIEKYFFKSVLIKELDEPKVKCLLEIILYFETGSRYAQKYEIIRNWMEQDRQKDNHYQNAVDPQNISCKFCDKEMELIYKSLDISIKSDQMLFVYACKECQFLKKIWEDGKVEERIPWKCPKCSRRLKISNKREGDKAITEKNCLFCGYQNKETLDLTPEKERPIDKVKEKEFRINKDRFCLSDKAGMEYVKWSHSVEKLEAISKENEKKRKLPKMKILNVPKLENKLQKVFASEKFTKLVFAEPDMVGDVTIAFSVQDPTSRCERDSRKLLKKLIEKTLNGINWKLMNAGIDYKLGVLTGGFRGRN